MCDDLEIVSKVRSAPFSIPSLLPSATPTDDYSLSSQSSLRLSKDQKPARRQEPGFCIIVEPPHCPHSACLQTPE